jgi:hypothetical protein
MGVTKSGERDGRAGAGRWVWSRTTSSGWYQLMVVVPGGVGVGVGVVMVVVMGSVAIVITIVIAIRMTRAGAQIRHKVVYTRGVRIVIRVTPVIR